MNLEIEDFISLVVKAIEKEQETLIWERWLALYPHMELKRFNFISFDNFKKDLLLHKPNPQSESDKSKEEIETEMMAVIAAYERR